MLSGASLCKTAHMFAFANATASAGLAVNSLGRWCGPPTTADLICNDFRHVRNRLRRSTKMSAIETANIGREGAFGLFAAMYSRVSFNRCIVQLEGHTVRCPIEVLQYEFKSSEYVRDLFVSYSETLLSQVQQTVACNSMHTTEARMCRWLLMMHDRAGGEALPYTHEFLSQILSANRKSVTLAAQSNADCRSY